MRWWLVFSPLSLQAAIEVNGLIILCFKHFFQIFSLTTGTANECLVSKRTRGTCNMPAGPPWLLALVMAMTVAGTRKWKGYMGPVALRASFYLLLNWHCMSWIWDIKKLSQQILYECWTKGLDEAILKDNFFPFTRVYLKATHFKALYCGYFLIPLFVVEKDILKYIRYLVNFSKCPIIGER